ncbi:uncharacterized protein PHACADRAFT_254086 [Phanerochaete carnosa HHB-10118-sp]|uniref:G-protein coupled receptors family 1 profile domain-containing protein n=1 Tax=Phanerochaete carnosa (strain HHB-10118-sp) TaxID=650164 RepID=K5WC37_PHACS|nr:uncharacterized protein PHACADRAFT_254086 [Phanerochaete carnosa HHB-10118-sp]EKM56770.1 hypothetical protein PHACADRAFT_254086 [Phanerochaete carnosa HHB-10118-sp]
MAPNAFAVRAAQTAPVPPPPPPGLNYIAPLRIAVRDLLIAHSFSILLVSLLIALLYFSTKQSRRQPIFLLNVFTILLALSVGALIDYQTIQTIIAPLDPTPLSFNIAIGVLGAVQSIIIDSILLVRLVSVYPPSYVGKRIFALILAVPVLLKVGRIINLCLFIKALADATKDPATANLLIARIWENAPYLKIEWFAQLFDNSYASGFFLYRLMLHNKEANRVMSRKTSETSFTDTIRTLLWVAATNFVVPVLFSLAQIIVVYRDIDVLVVNDIVLVNTSIAVIGVVFATVWAGTAQWAQGQSRTALDASEPSRVVFQNTLGGSSAEGVEVEDVEYGAAFARLSQTKDE